MILRSINVYTVFLLIVSLCCLASCKTDNKKPLVQDAMDIKYQDIVGPDGKSVNLLKYKVKQEDFGTDNLGIEFKNIYLSIFAEDEFKLKVEIVSSDSMPTNYSDYYMIFNIYPKDEEKGLLDKERRKYGFESFSMKINKNRSDNLVASRRIRTKIRIARAVTLSILSYDSKKKHEETVLQNVNFLN